MEMHIVVDAKEDQATIYYDFGSKVVSAFAIGPLAPQTAKAICEGWLANGDISSFTMTAA